VAIVSSGTCSKPLVITEELVPLGTDLVQLGTDLVQLNSLGIRGAAALTRQGCIPRERHLRGLAGIDT
jgi:hypothetical protein